MHTLSGGYFRIPIFLLLLLVSLVHPMSERACMCGAMQYNRHTRYISI
jgi:hypothetical protein